MGFPDFPGEGSGGGVTGFLGAPNSGTSEGLGNPGLGNWISAEDLGRGGKAAETGSSLSS